MKHELEVLQKNSNEKPWEEFTNRNLKSFLLTNLIKFNQREFEELLKLVTPILETLNTRGSRYRRRSNRPEKVSFTSHLFITLFWLRQYPIDAVMSCIFGLDRRKTTRIIRRTLTALREALKNEISWPSETQFEKVKQKWNSCLPQELKDAVAIIDGTELSISRPSDPYWQKATYSIKKKQHSLTIMVICQPDGTIIYASDPLVGSSDQHHWNNLNLRQLFEDKKFGIIGDCGFTFNHKDGEEKMGEIPIIGYTPQKRPRKGKLSRIQKKRNRRLSQFRVIIENVNACIKDWMVVGSKYRHHSLCSNNQLEITLVIQTVLRLAAYYIRLHPLRTKDWQPKQ